MKSLLTSFLVGFSASLIPLKTFATPSTQVWIPSPDVQAHRTLHLGIDNYVRHHSTSNNPNYIDIGATAGLGLFSWLGVEAGVDYLQGGQGGPVFGVEADRHPIYFNAKAGVPQDALFRGSPALAFGGYNFGTHPSTQQNISYGLLARNVPFLGRLSAGGYRGNQDVLGSDRSGVLLSWDRTLREVSDRLWLAVDYMSGKNFNGSTNIGAAWAFNNTTSLLVGYDIYNSRELGGSNTFTTQLDINLN